ncbi:MAG TPA: AAA family ATPase [Micromonosporaceae bacterium]|jgi:predicted kinase
MSTLIITRGLPGSGKTTRAKQWVDEDPTKRARVNRDDLRAMLHGGYADVERQINAARDAAITALLKVGVDVIADDTNLRSRYVRDLRNLALAAGAEFDVWDLTDVPVEVCVERDAVRSPSIGERVIRDMYERYLAGKPYPLPLPPVRTAGAGGKGGFYNPPADGADAILVDIDGTVALLGDRSPYDETRVNLDRPNEPVVRAVAAMAAAGHRIVFCSGRTEQARPATEAWLRKHVGVGYDGLFMRASGDVRKDSIVKRELFDRHIRGRFRIAFVLDDRAQVVEMWRGLGLTVFQVAPGDF